MLTFRTYNRVWRLERVLYRINDFRLPFAVTPRQVVIFACTLVVMMLLPLDHVPLLNQFFMRYAGVPGAVAWVSTKWKLDGRNPLIWAWCVTRFWMSPRRWVRLQPYHPPARPERVEGVIVIRRRPTINLSSLSSEGAHTCELHTCNKGTSGQGDKTTDQRRRNPAKR